MWILIASFNVRVQSSGSGMPPRRRSFIPNCAPPRRRSFIPNYGVCGKCAAARWLHPNKWFYAPKKKTLFFNLVVGCPSLLRFLLQLFNTYIYKYNHKLSYQSIKIFYWIIFNDVIEISQFIHKFSSWLNSWIILFWFMSIIHIISSLDSWTIITEAKSQVILVKLFKKLFFLKSWKKYLLLAKM